MSTEPDPSRNFGRYRLDELLGRGGMGDVYRAFDTETERDVAVKRLRPELAQEKTYRERFQRESKIVSRLNEPHIIPVHNFGEINGWLYIEMRLVKGLDLAALLDQFGPLPAERAVSIVVQIADALAAAHGEGLVHRDVKPSNILVAGSSHGGDGFVYLTDFGIARSTTSTSLTMTGAAIGTLHYMAPERFAGRGDDPSADVYALGCVLYEALTARKPFAAEDPAAQMFAHTRTPPPAPSHRMPNLPAALDDVVARAMAKDPRQRHPTAIEFATAARAALVAGPAAPVAAQTVTAASFAIGASISVRSAVGDAPNGAAASRWSRRGPRKWITGTVAVSAGAAMALALWGATAQWTPRVTAAPENPAVVAAGVPRNTVIATVGVGAYPIGVAASAGVPKVYIANSDSAAVSVFDTAAGTVTSTVKVGGSPFDVALAPDGSRAYVTNISDNSISVIDTADDSVVATVPVGASPRGLAANPRGTDVYFTTVGSNTLSVLDTTTRTVTSSIPVGNFPISVALDEAGARAYVSNIQSNTVSVIDTAAGMAVATVQVGTSPSDAVVSPDGKRVYVANNAASSLSIIDTRTDTVIATVPLVADPDRLAVTPDGRRVYALSPGTESTVSMIDTSSLSVASTFRVGPHSADITISADGTRAYVTDNAANTVSVVDITAG
ncbi:serine/threonine-protein kinase [Pseudonocardia sp. TRM90224]|uniref:serine/threonine-protein kinase n=1 Tax=Pseudonocardia sp. TRM90224 TaxID=2812678 RepID=UPI001E314BE9|nr:serine/threonine-protein kinase [Pseudonocardia sp. TRM90224]